MSQSQQKTSLTSNLTDVERESLLRRAPPPSSLLVLELRHRTAGRPAPPRVLGYVRAVENRQSGLSEGMWESLGLVAKLLSSVPYADGLLGRPLIASLMLPLRVKRPRAILDPFRLCRKRCIRMLLLLDKSNRC
jgi:hypothetical protein